MKIGIVGAGQNSASHIRFSRSYHGAEIVGVADVDLRRAETCARQHGIAGAYGSVSELLARGAPDLVHVVTPPRTHLAVARELLEAGRHAIIEKPMALNARDAETLYATAERAGVQLCPIHNHLFDPCMQRADALVKSGALGQVINVESYYGLNTQIPAFRDYPRPNVLPWLYGLPGGVYQDFLPHPLYVLLEYTGRCRQLTVMQRATGVLPQSLPDELRVLVDGEHALGTLTFSFAARPHLHFIRIYGTRAMVEVDINTMTMVWHPVSALPKAAQKATYNVSASWQLARSTAANVFKFVTGSLKPYQGMETLIHRFYDAIETGAPAPVSKDAALGVVRTMDRIFEQLRYEPLANEPIAAAAVTRPHKSSKKVLVTGGTGFVGRALVTRLIADGYSVRVLARKLSRVDTLTAIGAEVFWGDVADLESFGRAFAGCDLVIHLAAGTSGREADAQTATLQGTANLIALCRRFRPSQLIYISSCSVYGIADCAPHSVLSETALLERHPDRRGHYSTSKQQAELEIADYMRSAEVPVVILRPGTIYGPGGELYSPMIGFSFGRVYAVIARRRFVLPLVYIDNLVDAIVRTIDAREAAGEIFNVVDPEPLSKREYMSRVIRRIQPDARVVSIPYALLYGITAFQELAFRMLGRAPVLTRYRLTSSQRPVVYDSRRIMSRLGWKPPVALDDALAAVVADRLRARETPALASPPQPALNVSSETHAGTPA